MAIASRGPMLAMIYGPTNKSFEDLSLLYCSKVTNYTPACKQMLTFIFREGLQVWELVLLVWLELLCCCEVVHLSLLPTL
jgi:hypothetical protein